MNERRELETRGGEALDNRTPVAFSGSDDDQTGRGVFEPGHREAADRPRARAVVRLEKAAYSETGIGGEVRDLGCERSRPCDVELIGHEPLNALRSSWWSASACAASGASVVTRSTCSVAE